MQTSYMRRTSMHMPSVWTKRWAGMTLIELMVALAIGSFLMLGAVTVFMQGRNTFRVNESVARLQENARFVLDAVEPNVRMAQYWGLTSRGDAIEIAGSPSAVTNDCAANWSYDIGTPVEGSDDGYDWAAGCAATASAASDTLVVRRASEEPITGAVDDDTIYIQSARVVASRLFQGDDGVPTLPGDSQTHRLIVSGYYVSPTSSLSTADNLVPSLRVKRLAPGPTVIDEEVLPGVEDMQVQFGVDTDPPGAATRGVVDIYVDPEDAILGVGDNRVLSVRVWFLLRAERPEQGHTDDTAYAYADRAAFTPNDQYRRVLISKTIFLRNAVPRI